MNRTLKTIISAATAVTLLVGATAPVFAAPPGGWGPGGMVMEPHPMFPPLGPGGFAPGGGGPGGGAEPPAPPAPPAVHDHHKHRNRALAAGALGFVAGAMMTGAMANQRAQAPSNELPSWWIAACAKRYKTYNVYDNSFMGFDGYRHQCDPR